MKENKPVLLYHVGFECVEFTLFKEGFYSMDCRFIVICEGLVVLKEFIVNGHFCLSLIAYAKTWHLYGQKDQGEYIARFGIHDGTGSAELPLSIASPCYGLEGRCPAT